MRLIGGATHSQRGSDCSKRHPLSSLFGIATPWRRSRRQREREQARRGPGLLPSIPSAKKLQSKGKGSSKKKKKSSKSCTENWKERCREMHCSRNFFFQMIVLQGFCMIFTVLKKDYTSIRTLRAVTVANCCAIRTSCILS